MLNIESIAESERDMPRFHGTILNPLSKLHHLRGWNYYVEAWRFWYQTHDRRHDPQWLKDAIAFRGHTAAKKMAPWTNTTSAARTSGTP